MNKTEMRRWMKRCRENLRMAEAALAQPGAPDTALLYDLFSDTACSAAELQAATEES